MTDRDRLTLEGVLARYDLNLWIADLFEGATYLPR